MQKEGEMQKQGKKEGLQGGGEAKGKLKLLSS